MALGPKIRKMFGRHEPAVASLYRSMFIDLDAYLARIEAWVPAPRRILEVGAGEGAVTERLDKAFPAAEILAIDIVPTVGRLYQGSRGHVTFAQKTVQEVAAEQPASFDFVILSDVIHHVPLALRAEIIGALRACLAPGGSLIFKDWASSPTPIHWLCKAGDVYLTGDNVSHVTPDEAEAMIETSFGKGAVIDRATVAPWRNNFAMLVRG